MQGTARRAPWGEGHPDTDPTRTGCSVGSTTGCSTAWGHAPTLLPSAPSPGAQRLMALRCPIPGTRPPPPLNPDFHVQAAPKLGSGCAHTAAWGRGVCRHRRLLRQCLSHGAAPHAAVAHSCLLSCPLTPASPGGCGTGQHPAGPSNPSMAQEQPAGGEEEGGCDALPGGTPGFGNPGPCAWLRIRGCSSALSSVLTAGADNPQEGIRECWRG